MGSRGKRSTAEGDTPVIITGKFRQRHDPPEDLTPAQATLWRETIASEHERVFSTVSSRAMLKDYCRHRSDADRVSAVMNQFKDEWLKSEEGLKRWREYSNQREKEVRAALAIARSLRLTNLSRYGNREAAADARRAAKGPMPWDDVVADDEEDA
jgi:hypothetical protein